MNISIYMNIHMKINSENIRTRSRHLTSAGNWNLGSCSRTGLVRRATVNLFFLQNWHLRRLLSHSRHRDNFQGSFSIISDNLLNRSLTFPCVSMYCHHTKKNVVSFIRLRQPFSVGRSGDGQSHSIQTSQELLVGLPENRHDQSG